MLNEWTVAGSTVLAMAGCLSGGVSHIFTALSAKALPHIDERKRSPGASIVLDVSDPRIERQVFRHLLIGKEIDGIEARTSRLGFRELKQRPSEPNSAMGWMNGDVVDKESLAGHGKDNDPPR